MTPVLQCTALSKSFDGISAAAGISLTVKKGEVLGIIGANGAGKTTLLNMISGYLTPSAGSIHVKGMDITGMPSRKVARMGVGRSFQIPQLFESSTALEVAILAISLAKDSGWRQFTSPVRHEGAARNLLATFQLSHLENEPISKIPQGSRKLLDIAIATCADPEIILLDEPTSGVSHEEKHQVMETLWSSFDRLGTTVLFIEHDMDLVRQYATRVAALYAGEVIADGDPDTVFSNPEVVQKICGTPAQHLRGNHA